MASCLPRNLQLGRRLPPHSLPANLCCISMRARQRDICQEKWTEHLHCQSEPLKVGETEAVTTASALLASICKAHFQDEEEGNDDDDLGESSLRNFVKQLLTVSRSSLLNELPLFKRTRSLGHRTFF